MADILSRLPINNVENLQAFLGLCSVDEVRAIFYGAMNQTQNGKTRLSRVNITNADLETELLCTGGRPRQSLTVTDFSKGRVKMMSFSHWFIWRTNVPHLTMKRSFLIDFEKLLINKDDGILYRVKTEKTQLVLPKKLIPLVFTELHMNMVTLAKTEHWH